MAVPSIQTALVAGELAPALYGRTDLARYHVGAATLRNLYVGYQGGAYSRAGTKFVGFSKQTGRAYAPRMIPFQFSNDQGLALEFGNQYMRVISDGAFVVENAIPITGITNASPVVVTAPGNGIASATPNTGSVISSYAPNDTVTLAGGTFTAPGVLSVTNTTLIGLQLNSPGAGVYAPADTIGLTGGTQSVAATLVVSSTQVVSATIAAGGSGGTNGTQTVTGTTGTGTKFQASVTVAGNAITAILSITVGGNYTVNPTTPTAEPVTGASLSGATLNIKLGVKAFSIFAGGTFTANAAGGTFTQASTSGSGTGATFQFALFGPKTMAVSSPGTYTALPSNPVAQASTSGSGIGATFNITSTGTAAFANGDWVFASVIGGMVNLNGNIYVVGNATTTTFALYDVYGNPIDSTAYPVYTGGGTLARVFTLTTPYGEADLAYLKFTQSADTMSICCVNQQTLTEYQPQDLTRTTDTNWTFSAVVAVPTVLPPATLTGSASSGGSVDYQYVATAVNPNDGTESVASPIASINSAVNIAATAGPITLTAAMVAGVNAYNFYKATPGLGASPPVGAQFGFVGTSFGTQFIDPNIVADFNQVPPEHQNPFAQGAITGAVPIAGGAGYTQAGVTYTINTSTGSGAILTPIVIGGSVVAFILVDSGKNYKPTDTITITGDGTGATATLNVGPDSGTYPSVVAYFQQRRGYMNTLNNPDTYFFSQPGAYTNFDTRDPPIDSDAITGTPWAVQVNGIQFATPVPGGLIVHTGLSAWLLAGASGGALSTTALTPSSQGAQPQGYNGCSSTVPPIKIEQDILFVQAKGSIYRNITYQIQGNIYSGPDITVNSSHLFTGYTIKEHAWCEEPYKLLWAVRSDGILLSLTWLKPQEVMGWARHDTNGLFESVCSVTELPVDALYVATQRFPGTNTAYMIERMDNRIWTAAEACWCVDCGLTLGQPTPAATLSASSATGLGACSGVTGLIGGDNYSAGTIATVVDAGPQSNGKGPGTGAVPVLTITGGVITAVAFPPGQQGRNYLNPELKLYDPANTGSGAQALITLDNSTTFTASSPVFSGGSVGSFIRMGGGIAEVTAYTDSQHVTGNMLSPIVAVIPSTQGPISQPSGSWTLTAPVTTVTAPHLANTVVTGLADGNVIPPTLADAAGKITLLEAATAVTIGLGFQAQFQSMYLEAGEPTLQGQRKKIAAATVRMQSSRGLKMGSNQPDGANQNPPQIAPVWNALQDVPDTGQGLPNPPRNALCTPLRSGDIRVPVQGGFAKQGQVCLQQDNPLPMNVLAIIPETLPGDAPQLKSSTKQERGRQAA